MNTPFDDQVAGQELASTARAVRAQYQKGLLGWFRDAEPAAGLALVSSALDRLAEVASSGGAHDLFQAAWAVSDALRDGSLAAGADERRLFRLLDGEIKRLGEQAEGAMPVSPDPELLHAFLRCAGSVATDTATVPSAEGNASVASTQGGDAEIRSAFMDEARKEIDTLNEGLSQWRAGTSHQEALAVARRALLSLRGGARLVGEAAVAGVAEAAEELLDRASPPSAAVNGLLDEAPALLLRLIDGNGVQSEVRAYLERAADAAAEQAVPDSPSEEGLSAFDDDEFLEDDEDLLGIFLGEAAELLEALDQELAAWGFAPDDAEQRAGLARTLRTLKRGAGLSDVLEMSDLCEAAELLLDSFGEGRGPNAWETLDLLRSAVARLRQQAGELRERGAAGPATDLIGMLEARAATGTTSSAGPAATGLPAFLADRESAAKAEDAGAQAVPAGPAGEIEAVRHRLGECTAALETDLVALDGLVSQLRRQVPAGGTGDIQEALLHEVERVRGNMGGHTEEICRLLHRQSDLLMQSLATRPDPPTESESP